VPPADEGRDRELAERAVAIAPDLPEARIALGTALIHDMRVAEAAPHFVESLRLAPGLVEQRSAFARILQECGVVMPALALAESTLEIEPGFIEPVGVLLRHHALRGRMSEAADLMSRWSVGRNTFLQVNFARYCIWARDRRRYDEVVAQMDLDQLDAQPRLVVEVMGAVLDGDRSAVARLAKVPGHNVRRHAFFQQVSAEVYAVADDRARCVEALEKAVALGLFDIEWLDLCKLFDPVRGTVRFETLRRTVHERAIVVLKGIERELQGEAV
jgi:hypothetical protein